MIGQRKPSKQRLTAARSRCSVYTLNTGFDCGIECLARRLRIMPVRQKILSLIAVG